MVFSKSKILGGSIFKEECFQISIVQIYGDSLSLVGLILTVQSNNVKWNKYGLYFSSESNIPLNPVSWREYILFLGEETKKKFYMRYFF